MGERVQTNAPAQAQAATHAARPSITPVRTAMLQRACACGQLPGTGGKCDDCDKKDQGKTLQRASNGAAGPTTIPPSVNQVLSSPGRPLDTPTRSFMESRFGHDFGSVRIHNDSAAAESARAVNAKAYTVGQNVVFGSGQYQPQTNHGKHLLAHELTHTIQQSGTSGIQPKLAVDVPGSASELEADRVATNVLADKPVNVSRHSGGQMQRAINLPCGDILMAPEPPAGQRVGGVRAHDAITDDFLSKAKTHAEDLAIPGATSQALRSGVCGDDEGGGRRRGGAPKEQDIVDEEGEKRKEFSGGVKEGGDRAFGYPDLAYRDQRNIELAEIKIGVTDCLTLAEQQVDRYIDQGNADDLKKWRTRRNIKSFLRMPTSRYTPKSPLTVDGRNIAVAWCEPGVIVYKTIDPSQAQWNKIAAASNTEAYTLRAGSNEAIIQVPKQSGKPKTEKVALADSDVPQNVTVAGTLIPGMVLLALNRKATGKDTVEACLTSATCAAKPGARGLPIKVGKGKERLTLNVDKATGALSLVKQLPIPFDYPYLSAGKITKLDFDPVKGISGEGKISPSLPLLNKLDLGIAFSTEEFKITVGVDPKKITPPFPGLKLIDPQLAIVLDPFKVSAGFGYEISRGAKKVVYGAVEVKTDGTEIVGTGTVKAAIPGVDEEKSKGEVTYQGGQWMGTIHVESTDIKLPGIKKGRVDAGFTNKGITGGGELDLEIPGGHTATVGLKYTGDHWEFRGKGIFKIPKLDDTTVYISYDGEKIYGEGDTGFKFYGIKGKFRVKFAAKPGGDRARIWGDGSLEFEKGRAKGKLDVHLNEKGNFSGEGTVTFLIKEGMTATGTIKIDEHEKVTIIGVLTFPPYQIFPRIPKEQKPINVFKVPAYRIPVPFLSFGPVGLKAQIRAGIIADYGIGPGELRGGYLKATFNPLEEQPDYDLEAGGELHVPGYFRLTAYVAGGLVLDVFIAEAGGEIILSASLSLNADVKAPLKLRYSSKEGFSAKGDLEMNLLLKLLLCLSAHAWAEAGFWRLKVSTGKTWHLAAFPYTLGSIGVRTKKPLSYSSVNGLELPEFELSDKPKFNEESAVKGAFGNVDGDNTDSKPDPKSECPEIPADD